MYQVKVLTAERDTCKQPKATSQQAVYYTFVANLGSKLVSSFAYFGPGLMSAMVSASPDSGGVFGHIKPVSLSATLGFSPQTVKLASLSLVLASVFLVCS